MKLEGKLLTLSIASLFLAAGPATAEEPATQDADRAKTAPSTESAEAAKDEMVAARDPAETQDMSLSKIAICEEVQERAPVGEADSFSNEIGSLTCFTRVQNAEAPTQVFHRWYVGNELVAEIPINVKAEQWRCWSTKSILPGWTGECRVEILSEQGDVLGTKTFVLQSTSAEG